MAILDKTKVNDSATVLASSFHVKLISIKVVIDEVTVKNVLVFNLLSVILEFNSYNIYFHSVGKEINNLYFSFLAK